MFDAGLGSVNFTDSCQLTWYGQTNIMIKKGVWHGRNTENS